jgi:hypothetical protein
MENRQKQNHVKDREGAVIFSRYIAFLSVNIRKISCEYVKRNVAYGSGQEMNVAENRRINSPISRRANENFC